MAQRWASWSSSSVASGQLEREGEREERERGEREREEKEREREEREREEREREREEQARMEGEKGVSVDYTLKWKASCFDLLFPHLFTVLIY